MDRNLFVEPPAMFREAESLKDLAAKIKDLTRQGLSRFREVGEALLQAKNRCQHGEFRQWVDENVPFSNRTAQRYMRLAENWTKCDTMTHLNEALEMLAENVTDEEVDAASTKPAKSKKKATKHEENDVDVPANFTCPQCGYGKEPPKPKATGKLCERCTRAGGKILACTRPGCG